MLRSKQNPPTGLDYPQPRVQGIPPAEEGTPLSKDWLLTFANTMTSVSSLEEGIIQTAFLMGRPDRVASRELASDFAHWMDQVLRWREILNFVIEGQVLLSMDDQQGLVARPTTVSERKELADRIQKSWDGIGGTDA